MIEHIYTDNNNFKICDLLILKSFYFLLPNNLNIIPYSA